MLNSNKKQRIEKNESTNEIRDVNFSVSEINLVPLCQRKIIIVRMRDECDCGADKYNEWQSPACRIEIPLMCQFPVTVKSHCSLWAAPAPRVCLPIRIIWRNYQPTDAQMNDRLPLQRASVLVPADKFAGCACARHWLLCRNGADHFSSIRKSLVSAPVQRTDELSAGAGRRAFIAIEAIGPVKEGAYICAEISLFRS